MKEVLVKFAHMSVGSHALFMVGVVCVVILVLVTVAGDDWREE